MYPEPTLELTPVTERADRARRWRSALAACALVVAAFAGAGAAVTLGAVNSSTTIEALSDEAPVAEVPADGAQVDGAQVDGTQVDGASTEVEPASSSSSLGLDPKAVEADRSGNTLGETSLDGDTATPELAATPAPAAPPSADDPFLGMTEAEINEMTDEEFFARLEAAGIEPEIVEGDPEDWEDSGDGHTHGEDGEAGGASDGEIDTAAATVAVDGDAIDTSKLDAETAATVTQIWNRFVHLIPADQRTMVTSFELAGGNFGGAYVYPHDDGETWTLGVSTGLGEDLDYVLIHEFGHLLTLNSGVINFDQNGSCDTYDTGDGCALKTSTIAEFVAKFWSQEQRDLIDKIQAGDEDQIEEKMQRFYDEHESDFVTDYATVSPVEDLAETFAEFVLRDRPTGTTIADQKIELLWADPDLVTLRTQIRTNAGLVRVVG